jgi:hypothetical protein
MNKLLAITTAAALTVTLLPVNAETAHERTLKAPEKTMGDEGKLPATKNMGNAIPDMTGPRTAASPATEKGSAASGPKGPPKRMGDEGKLPATKNMSGAVPDMTGPDATK